MRLSFLKKRSFWMVLPGLAALFVLIQVRRESTRPPVWRVGRWRFMLGRLPPPDPVVRRALNPASLCPAPTAPLDRVLYDQLQGKGAALSYGNRFMGLLHFPLDGYGSYDLMADQIRAARREVLMANMVWDAGEESPGTRLAAALADLRRRVLAYPAQYPQGLTVRILLGNSVRFDSPFDPTTNVYNAASQLLEAGLIIGEVRGEWRLKVANARFTFPHNHMKLLVIDGEDVNAGGYNISNLHLPRTFPEGVALSDLAMRFRGPVARQAAASFHDAWRWSQCLTCTPDAAPGTVRQDCHLRHTTRPYPLWGEPPAPVGEARVYGLYRRNGFESGDQALKALLGAARSHIDLLQSQVSGDLACELSFTCPGGCAAPERLLPVWATILSAIEERGVRVRLVLDRAPVLQIEAIQLLGGLLPYLKARGLEDHLEARWSTNEGGLHTKAVLVDGEMTVVGSTNLHFSSSGALGLTEYDLATSDPAAIEAVQAVFDDEWQQGEQVVLPFWLRP